jgi:hypothetical protein
MSNHNRAARRAAERKARKLSEKTIKATAVQTPTAGHATPEDAAFQAALDYLRQPPPPLPAFVEEYRARLQNQRTTTAPVSDAKLAANRANAQHSTGPLTAAGKAASSQNNFKHGLYSKQVVVQGEDPAELDALKADLRAEHQPANTTEELLVNEMAEQYWRLQRARRIEAHLFADGAPIITQMNAVTRLMSSAERGFYKALKTLRELQKPAAKRCVAGNGMEVATPPRSALPAVPEKQRGFVLQKQEIAVTAPPPVSSKGAAIGGFVPQKTAIGNVEEELALLETEFAATELSLNAA